MKFPLHRHQVVEILKYNPTFRGVSNFLIFSKGADVRIYVTSLHPLLALSQKWDSGPFDATFEIPPSVTRSGGNLKYNPIRACQVTSISLFGGIRIYVTSLNPLPALCAQMQDNGPLGANLKSPLSYAKRRKF